TAAPQSRASRGPAGSPQAVETELRAWARANSRRDDAIREAIAAGVSVHRIQEVTGIARTTIMRILGAPSRAPRRSPRPSPRAEHRPARRRLPRSGVACVGGHYCDSVVP